MIFFGSRNDQPVDPQKFSGFAAETLERESGSATPEALGALVATLEEQLSAAGAFLNLIKDL